MELSPERCYRALRSRDSRFDGRFFVGVVTTGIYCRPICPAPTPRERNVRFFPCAAAAEEEAFRPCRRCRPETSPGTPVWSGSTATVSRALRLISEGGLDGSGVEHLASRLGIGARHLRRLVTQHLGASPLSIARTQRVHLARRLIDETTLPMEAIARSAGFSSVRQFNHAVRATFKRSPTELRRNRRSVQDSETGGDLRMRVGYRPPFDWLGLLGFLALRATPGVEAVQDGRYVRTVRVGDLHGTITVEALEGVPELLLRVHLPSLPGLQSVVERVRRIFDLTADPLRIANDLARDPALAPRIRARPGIRVPGAWDPFELAVRAVLGQQVTVKGATTLAGRLVRAFGKPIDAPSTSLTHLFPTADTLAESDFAGIGLPAARAETIRALARSVADGCLTLDGAAGLDDVVGDLRGVSGIGAWTAHYVAMRALGEPDAFPAGDLGLRKAAGTNGRPLTASVLERKAEAWRPWRAYAAMWLWSGPAPAGHR
jgi:AraC family transcriptional regulator of adaptative response / DNA-3-methyladenine glycosylase II